MIELRSDTFTRPSIAMREVISSAEVGDDVYGEDPTVKRLQQTVAAMVSQEEALFFPTATMSNLAACMAHCHEGRHNEVIIGDISHQATFEVGNLSTLGHMFPRMVPTDPATGCIELATLRKSILGLDIHCTVPKVVVLENTHCFLGGKVLPLSYVRDVRYWAKNAQTDHRGFTMMTHCDGARLWNASVASGVSTADFGAQFDSVSVCLSKGLGCPAGSVLAGPTPFIHRARQIRKMLGGGMRQAGIIAAAGLYALKHVYPSQIRLDHENAQRLYEGVANIESLVAETPTTNMVLLRTSRAGPHLAAELVSEALTRGVKLSLNDHDCARAVTHLNVSTEDCVRASAILKTAWDAVLKRTRQP